MKMLLLFWILLDVSLQVSAVEKTEGDSVLLPCSFPTSERERPTVVWSRSDLSPSTVHQRQEEGDELMDQNQLYRGRTSMKTDALDSGDLTLTLTQLQVSDTGTYTCSFRDSMEELRVTDRELRVKERIPSWAKGLLVLLGLVLLVSAGLLYHYRHYFMSGYRVEVKSGVESVLLPCKTIKRLPGDATVEWRERGGRTVHVYQNGSDYPKEQDQFYSNRTRMNEDLLRTGDLSLTLIGPTYSNIYTCSITNKDGDILMVKQVRLKVKAQQVEVEEGAESVELPFRTTPDLPGDIRVEWRDNIDWMVHMYKNGSDQLKEQNHFYRTRTRMNEDLLRTGDLSLTLRWPSDGDSRTYTCIVSIRDGDILMEKKVHLEVKVQQVEVEEGAESVLLPWKTTVQLPEDARVEWKNRLDRLIHVYQNGSDQHVEQDKNYRTRTNMNEDLMRTGDISLTLRRPTSGDSGEYICEVRKNGKLLRFKRLDLKVKAKTVQVQPEDIRTRTIYTDPSPLLADQSV